MLYLNAFGHGETIVFLHGALVSSKIWSDQVEYFHNNYQTVVIDLPEHGESRDFYIREYTVEAIAKAVLDTLDNQGISCFHLCGHSLGGMVAQEIAITQRDRVKTLILAETSFGTRNSLIERIASHLTKGILYVITQKQLVNMSSKQYGRVSQTTKDFISLEMSSYDSKQSRRIMGAPLHYSSLDKLNTIKAKTLILIGEFNKQTHAQAKRMNKEIRNSELIQIPNSHHLVNLDNPPFFNNAINIFLNS